MLPSRLMVIKIRFILKLILYSITLLFIFQVNGCKTQDDEKTNDLEININTNGKSKKENLTNGILFSYPITIKLKNISDSVINFWTMKCAWEVNWVINTKWASLSSRECDSNFPTLVNLNPGDHVEFTGDIHTMDSTLKKCRLAFVWVAKSEYTNKLYTSLMPIIKMKKNENHDVFWSDEIHLY